MFFRITMVYTIYLRIQRDTVDVQADKVGTVALSLFLCTYRRADKSLVRPGRKQATVTEKFDVHVSYLSS